MFGSANTKSFGEFPKNGDCSCGILRSNVDKVVLISKGSSFLRYRFDTTIITTLFSRILQSRSISRWTIDLALSIGADDYCSHKSLAMFCIIQSVGAEVVLVHRRRICIFPSFITLTCECTKLSY